jgi:hypothetical protein
VYTEDESLPGSQIPLAIACRSPTSGSEVNLDINLGFTHARQEEASRLRELHGSSYHCRSDDVEFTWDFIANDINYILGSGPHLQEAFGYDRDHDYCDVEYLLHEDWDAPYNFNRGNPAIDDYIHDFDPADGTFRLEVDDDRLDGRTYWMKLTVRDAGYPLNQDFKYWKINFIAGSPSPSCDNFSLTSPEFALSPPSCYEVNLWEDANWTDFTPAEQTPAGCGTITYTLLYSDVGLLNDMTQFSIVDDALVGHPTYDLFPQTAPPLSEIEFSITVKATLDVDGDKEYAWSNTICIKVTNPCPDTDILTSPISDPFVVYRGTPEPFDLLQYGLPWPNSADLATLADGSHKCGS